MGFFASSIAFAPIVSIVSLIFFQGIGWDDPGVSGAAPPMKWMEIVQIAGGILVWCLWTAGVVVAFFQLIRLIFGEVISLHRDKIRFPSKIESYRKERIQNIDVEWNDGNWSVVLGDRCFLINAVMSEIERDWLLSFLEDWRKS